MRNLALVLAVAACSPSVEKVPRGSENHVSVDEYTDTLRHTIDGQVQRYSDIEGGILLTARNCTGIKATIRERMPDGSYITCREGKRIIWEMDRR
jgi:hypothetical protein